MGAHRARWGAFGLVPAGSPEPRGLWTEKDLLLTALWGLAGSYCLVVEPEEQNYPNMPLIFLTNLM